MKYINGIKTPPNKIGFIKGMINILDGFTYDGKFRCKDSGRGTYHYEHIKGKLTGKDYYVSMPEDVWRKRNPYKHSFAIKVMDYGNKGITVETYLKDGSFRSETFGKERFI